MDGAPALSVISRSDALRLRLARFFTGEPCVHGHVAERYVSSGGCTQCSSPSGHAARSAFLVPRKRHSAEIVEPSQWPRDDHLRREPVIDSFDGRVIRLVGYRACMTCKASFFSRDVKLIRMCDACKNGTDFEARKFHHP